MWVTKDSMWRKTLVKKTKRDITCSRLLGPYLRQGEVLFGFLLCDFWNLNLNLN